MRLPGLVLFVVAVECDHDRGANAGAETWRPSTRHGAPRCHEAGVARAPNRDGLRRLAPEAIAAALTTGSMRVQGQELTLAQIQLLARGLGNAPAATAPANAVCSANQPAAFINPLDQPNWNGWGANLAQHRFQPAAMAQLSASDVPRLKLKWAFAFQGVNRVFRAADGRRRTRLRRQRQQHRVLAERQQRLPVLGVQSRRAGANRNHDWPRQRSRQWLAYFGDQRANAYAIDALTGTLVWKRSVDSFPGAHDHRRTDAGRRHALRRDLVGRGSARAPIRNTSAADSAAASRR